MENIVKLKYPIEIKTNNGSVQSINTLTFGRIKVGHLELFPSYIFEQLADGKEPSMHPKDFIPMIAGMTGITIEEVKKIDIEDLTPIMDIMITKMEGMQPPEIGKK